MEYIKGGVCAAKGFKAAGVHCGIRKNKDKKDLALIVSEQPCAAAATYTKNLVQGAPIAVTKRNLVNGCAKAIICNSGNANTCNADGEKVAAKMCALVQQHLGIPSEDVVVASTGVIGQPLDITPIANGMTALVAALGDHNDDAVAAIMTTDTKKKTAAVSFTLGGVECHLGGIVKGSGMIHPNMATMLAFLTTDAAISPAMLQKALSADIVDTYNMTSVDGDTSTNDTCCILANGMAGNAEITAEGADYDAFCAALHAVNAVLCRGIAGDGEGATKMLECVVCNAKDKQTARTAAKAVICSSLLKAAMFGADANWGRVLCALGYCGAPLDVHKIDVGFKSDAGEITVCQNGAGIPFSEETAKTVLLRPEITIAINLHDGDESATAWGCDLTYDYVKINGDYRT